MMPTRLLIRLFVIVCFGIAGLITTSRAAETTTLVVLYTSNTNGLLDVCD